MAATTTQKSNRPEPLQEESETDSEFYSDDEYSDEDDYTDEEDEVPAKNQPQRPNQLQRQRQPQPKQQNKKSYQQQQPIRDQPKKEENSPFAEGGSMAMQPFEHIGPPSSSMDGPVTYARAQRGEIPLREGNPNQKLQTGEKSSKSIDDQEGLKLKLELNLDIEIELKASIHGDLTLALL